MHAASRRAHADVNRNSQRDADGYADEHSDAIAQRDADAPTDEHAASQRDRDTSSHAHGDSDSAPYCRSPSNSERGANLR